MLEAIAAVAAIVLLWTAFIALYKSTQDEDTF